MFRVQLRHEEGPGLHLYPTIAVTHLSIGSDCVRISEKGDPSIGPKYVIVLVFENHLHSKEQLLLALLNQLRLSLVPTSAAKAEPASAWLWLNGVFVETSKIIFCI